MDHYPWGYFAIAGDDWETFRSVLTAAPWPLGKVVSMAAHPARRPANYEDVLRALGHLVAEVSSGDVYTSPRPAGPHSEAASVLSGPITRAQGATAQMGFGPLKAWYGFGRPVPSGHAAFIPFF